MGCLKTVLLVFNSIFLLVGMGLVGLGAYVGFQLDDYNALLGSSIAPYAVYIMLGTGGFVLVVSLFGCIGVLAESRKLLAVYFGLQLTIFLLEAATAIMGFMFYDKAKPFLDEYVTEAIMDEYGKSSFLLATEAIDAMQIQFKCCGYNSPQDWSTATGFNSTDVEVPFSCCVDKNKPLCNAESNSTLVYQQGCGEALADWLTDNIIEAASLAVGVAVFQLLLMVFTCCQWKEYGGDSVSAFV